MGVLLGTNRLERASVGIESGVVAPSDSNIGTMMRRSPTSGVEEQHPVVVNC